MLLIIVVILFYLSVGDEISSHDTSTLWSRLCLSISYATFPHVLERHNKYLCQIPHIIIFCMKAIIILSNNITFIFQIMTFRKYLFCADQNQSD